MLPISFCEEPTCSPFDYDKKLLEKMIRMEISFENVKRIVESANENVDKGLTELKSDRDGVQSEVESLKTDVHLMKNELKEFIQTLKQDVQTEDEKRNRQMTDVFQQQQAIITRMSADLFELKNKTIAEITGISIF